MLIVTIYAETAANTEVDSFQSGRALAETFTNLESPPKAIIVYATQAHDPKRLLEGIKEVFPEDVVIAGGSEQGFFERSNYFEKGFAAGAMALGGDLCAESVLSKEISAPEQQGHEAGQQLRQRLGTDPKLAILYFDPSLLSSMDPYLRGLGEELQCPLVGGGTGHEFGAALNKTTQISNTDHVSGGVSVLALGGNLGFEMVATNGSITSGLEFTITKTDGANILELDNQPIESTLADIFGQEAQYDTYLQISLQIAEQCGMYGPTSRTLGLLQLQDRPGYRLLANLSEGTEVELSLRNEDVLFEDMELMSSQLRESLGQKPIRAVLGFECGARPRFLGKDQAVAENHKLQQLLDPQAPWLGALAWGEIVPTSVAPALIYNFTYPLICLTDA